MKDFLLDGAGLMIKDNDLAVGFSDFQHQEHLLIAHKGSVKRFPDVGVGIENYDNDTEVDSMLSEIRAQFEGDGMTVKNLDYDFETGELTYDANYNS
ncbi:MAG: hypothetical protein ACTHK8_19070 [Ginsengibacter sp.]